MPQVKAATHGAECPCWKGLTLGNVHNSLLGILQDRECWLPEVVAGKPGRGPAMSPSSTSLD